MIRIRHVAAVAVLALAPACSDDDAHDDAGPRDVAPAPAACAGKVRDGLSETRTYAWDAARQLLTDDPAAEVWLGFSRILSVDEVGELLQPLTVHGAQLVYEQQQGTYAKVLSRITDVAADDPELRAEVSALLRRHAGMANPLPQFGGPDAFVPADPEVAAGEPPIAGLVVSGDVAAVLADDPCLIFSMATGDAPTGPDISPQIEPDPIRIDPEAR